MSVPIADQLAEVEREIRQRERVYPKWIAAGRLKADTAANKMRSLEAAAATLRVVSEHADGLRTLVAYLRRERSSRAADYVTGDTVETPIPDAEDTTALLEHPAVAELLRHFPEATLASIEPVTPRPDREEMLL
jgi:hypothetical protein